MKEIRKLASGLTERYGTNCPFQLCEFLNIPLLRLELPKRMRGFCLKQETGRPVIVLNTDMDTPESDYCCAHELGHVLLHPGLNAMVIADLTNLCPGRYENEADYFAACLLIDPNLEEWKRMYEPLTLERISLLTGLPPRVVSLRFSH